MGTVQDPMKGIALLFMYRLSQVVTATLVVSPWQVPAEAAGNLPRSRLKQETFTTSCRDPN